MNIQPIFDVIDWAQRTKVAGPFTWAHLFILIVILSIAYNTYMRYGPGRNARKYMIHARCNDCGWLGEVSKLQKVCGKCRSTSMRLLTPADAKDLEKVQAKKRRR